MPGDDTYQVEPGHPTLRALLHGQLLVTVVLADGIGRPVVQASPEGRLLLAEAAALRRSMDMT